MKGKQPPKQKKEPPKRRVQEVQISSADEKDVFWYPESLKEDIKKDWPEQMRKDGGFQLGRVQQGLDPDNYRPMPTIGTGVKEIKLQDKDKSQYRLIYIASFAEGIYVFHVITKKDHRADFIPRHPDCKKATKRNHRAPQEE